jgi:hypothetical protein
MARTRTTVTPGTRLAVTHGAHSKFLVARKAEDILSQWTDPEHGLPLAHPVDSVAISAAARSAAIFTMLADYVEQEGPLDRRGVPRPATRLLFRGLDSLMAALRQLGATPASRAEMASGLGEVRRRAQADAAAADFRRRYGAESAQEAQNGAHPTDDTYEPAPLSGGATEAGA